MLQLTGNATVHILNVSNLWKNKKNIYIYTYIAIKGNISFVIIVFVF